LEGNIIDIEATSVWGWSCHRHCKVIDPSIEVTNSCMKNFLNSL
jgi:hypothetical protein